MGVYILVVWVNMNGLWSAARAASIPHVNNCRGLALILLTLFKWYQ